jgi:hypothetical protein
MKFGIMPAHTATFIKKEIFNEYGLYNEKFKIAGDFDFFYRIFIFKNCKFEYYKKIIARMRTGGISSKNFKSYITSSLEIAKVISDKNIFLGLAKSILRVPSKILQFFNFKSVILNSEFKIVYTNFFKKFYKVDFKIISSINKINFKTDFILSALNLAFLASYVKGDIIKRDFLINWPDGIFAKIFRTGLKKIPGREILRNLKLPSYIKKIVVVGNLSDIANKYLSNRFKREILHYQISFGSFEKIKTELNFKVDKNHLILITLPTPKQEQIADYLAKSNSSFKIICIGGSLAIASGQEKEVPVSLSYLEFIWRLQYETIRRSRRIVSTFIYYIYGYFTNRYRNLHIEIL